MQNVRWQPSLSGHGGASNGGSATGRTRAHLHEVVLHDITDDAKLVKVAPAPLRANVLLEADLDIGD